MFDFAKFEALRKPTFDFLQSDTGKALLDFEMAVSEYWKAQSDKNMPFERMLCLDDALTTARNNIIAKIMER